MSDATDAFQSCAENMPYYSEQLMDELNNASSSWSEAVSDATSHPGFNDTLEAPIAGLGKVRQHMSNSNSYIMIVSCYFCYCCELLLC